MVKIGGLWKRQGKNGDFLAGKLGTANLMIFKNTKKRNAQDPDYSIMVAEPENKGYNQPLGRNEEEPPIPENEF